MRLRNLATLLVLVAGCEPAAPPECSALQKIRAFSDLDGDGFGDPATETQVCKLAEDQSAIGRDCDDTKANVSPNGLEVCDGQDNDCNTTPDDGLPLTTYYADADGDGFGNALAPIEACNQPDNAVYDNTDCNDNDALINPIAPEVCDKGVDNDCDLRADDDDADRELSSAPAWYFDEDNDGYGTPDAFILMCENPRPDQLVANADDCDDSTALLNPGVTEVCNGFDDDCDALYDESDPDLDQSTLSTWWYDSDGDGTGDPLFVSLACEQPFFYTNNDDDCDDDNPLLSVPAFWLPDLDGDTYGTGVPVGPTCAPPTPDYGLQAAGIDCNDANPAVNPGATEICNGIDDDCDTRADDLDLDIDPLVLNDWYVDPDNDDYGSGAAVLQCAKPPGHAPDDGDCNQMSNQINPGMTEVCNTADDDCDTLVDEADPSLDAATLEPWYPDVDGDGFGDETLAVNACSAPTDIYVQVPGDCDDADPALGLPTEWYTDSDGDGYGDGAPLGPPACAPQVVGGVALDGDCRPNDITVNPGAFDLCEDGIDQDCVAGDKPCGEPSCDDILALEPASPSGTYTIEPTPGQPFDVWCDMTTDGGGWSLVASSGASVTIQDQAIGYHTDLQDLNPTAGHNGIWDGLRPVLGVLSDIRFACNTSAASASFAVDLSFYGVDWYDEATTGADVASCLDVIPAFPSRRDNLTGVLKTSADTYNSGTLKLEDTCVDGGDFTVDFDDRGMDGNPADGTDWGADDFVAKCGAGLGEEWFIFVR